MIRKQIGIAAMNLKESELGETLSEKAFLLFPAISQDIYESFGLQYIADIQNNVCKNVWLKESTSRKYVVP